MEIKKIISLICISNNCLAAGNYVIQNNGKQNSYNTNYLAVYDPSAYSSGSGVLLGGYIDETTDNGHCAQGIVKGQLLTLLMPLDLTKLGFIIPQCTVSGQQTTKGSSITVPAECASKLEMQQCKQDPTQCVNEVLCGAVVVEGSGVEIQGKETVLHVSPPCQTLYTYAQKNWADPSSTNHSASEYAACDGGVSYCAISFIPKDNLQISFDTNLSLVLGNDKPGVCSLAPENPRPTGYPDLASEATNYSDCNFTTIGMQNNAPSCSFYMHITSVNEWISNNIFSISQNVTQQDGIVIPQPLGFLKCTFEPAAYEKQIDNLYSQNLFNVEQETENAVNGYFKLQLPGHSLITNYSSDLSSLTTHEQTLMRTYYENFIAAGAKHTTQDYQTQWDKFYKQFSDQQNKFTADKANLGIPFTGNVAYSANGDPILTFVGSLPFTPAYDCTFMFTVPKDQVGCGKNGNCTEMELISAYCNTPASILVNNSVTACGFAGEAENQTPYSAKIGSGTNAITFELSNAATIVPFKTATSRPPICLGGLTAYLGELS